MAKEPKDLEKVLGLHELSPIALSVSSGTLSIDGSSLPDKSIASSSTSSLAASKNPEQHPTKSWHIQPTCAITGEGEFVFFIHHLLSNHANSKMQSNVHSLSKTAVKVSTFKSVFLFIHFRSS